MLFPVDKDRYTYQWFIECFEQAKNEAIQFCRPIDRDLFVQQPAEGVWSLAQCYSHLNEFGEWYKKSIQGGLNGASHNPADPDRPFTPRLIWKGVIWLFAPPYKIKMRTFKPFEPTADLDKEYVLDNFLRLQDTFIRELEKARTDNINLAGIKVSNPILRFVKMTLGECFAVVEVHQRRHLWQAGQILDKLVNGDF